jgi:hypothetical protein
MKEETSKAETATRPAPNTTKIEDARIGAVEVEKVIVLSLRGLERRQIANYKNNLHNLSIAAASKASFLSNQNTITNTALKDYGDLYCILSREDANL